MAFRAKIVLAGLFAFAAASAAFASDQRGSDGETTAAPTAIVLVRIHKVTGLNADNREQVLYASDRGTLVPLYDLAQVGTRLQTGPGIADGVYHDLKVELANDIQVYGSGSEPVHTRFKPNGESTVLRMLGTVVFANGEITPRSLALDTGRTSDSYDAERPIDGDPGRVKHERHEHADEEDDEDD